MASTQWNLANIDKLRKYRRDWYKRNSDRSIQKVKDRRKKLVAWWRSYKRTLSCCQCGESEPVCLDFHHLDPSSKELCLSKMVTKGWSIKRTMREAEKCIVLCSNCHKKLHAGLIVVSK